MKFAEFVQKKRLEEGIATGRMGAKEVTCTGVEQSPDGSVSLKITTQDGRSGSTSPVAPGGLKNLNVKDEQGRMIWAVKTANSIYHAAMDPTVAQKVAQAIYASNKKPATPVAQPQQPQGAMPVPPMGQSMLQGRPQR